VLPNYQIEEKSDKKIIIEKKYLPIKVNKTFFRSKTCSYGKKLIAIKTEEKENKCFNTNNNNFICD
jgi:hypothetical protein